MELAKGDRIRRLVIVLSAAVTVIAEGGAQAQVLFAPPVHYPTGGQPYDVQASDLDLDGWTDLAVVNYTGSVTILRNQGDGTFEEADQLIAGPQPRAGAIGGFDDDIYPDLAVANSGSSYVSVFINRGDGTFDAAVDYTVGNEPWGIIAEDLDGDLAVDLAVVLRSSLSLTLLMNDGSGAFVPGGSYYAGGAYIKPSWLVAGDIDDDQDADIVVVKNYHNLYFNAGYVEVFTNDGSGGLSSSGTTELGRTATTPMMVDLDGDQDLDLAVSGFVNNSYRISVLLNDGAGNFGPSSTYSMAADGRACTGDFDADGDFDFAVSAQGVSSHSFSYVLNHGDATFTSPLTVSAGDDPMGPAAWDFDRDGDTDVAVAVSGENTVAVAMSTADPPTTALAGRGVARRSVVLEQNQPNPFNPATAIRFGLTRETAIELAVFDTRGRLVRVLDRGTRGAGTHRISWDGTDGRGNEVAGGVYVYRLSAGPHTQQRKMVLVK